MSVSVTRRVERMLEPWPSRNSLRIAPIALHLHELLVYPESICATQAPALNRPASALIQLAAGLLKFGDVPLQRSKINMSSDVARIVQIVHKLTDMLSIRLKIKRQNFGVR